MNKVEALDQIKTNWEDKDIKLGDKISSISDLFYSAGLDLSGTAAFIKATPSELEALLSLGALNSEILDMISDVNPPKTTWTMLGNASDEEIIEALQGLKNDKDKFKMDDTHITYSEYVYNKMIEISGLPVEEKVLEIEPDELKHFLKKDEDFKVLNDWSVRFLKSIIANERKGKVLSVKQKKKLVETLVQLADNNVITRRSVDGDGELCNKVLDILGR